MKKRCNVCGALNFDRDICSNCKSSLDGLAIDYAKIEESDNMRAKIDLKDDELSSLSGWKTNNDEKEEVISLEKLPKRKFKEKAFPLGTKKHEDEIKEEGGDDSNESILFLGELGIGRMPKNNVCGVYIQDGEFAVRFQQRNDIKIDIGDEITQKDDLYSLLTIKTPNINKLPPEAQENLLLQTKNLRSSPNNPKYIPLKSKTEKAKINFGHLIIAATGLTVPGQRNSNVIELISPHSVRQNLENKGGYITNKVHINTDVLKENFESDSLIQHELFVKEEEFRWEYPISIKAELETPLVSLMKTISVYDKKNPEIFKKFGLIEELNTEALNEFLKAKYWGGKAEDFIGIYPALFNNTALATVRIHLTNSTIQQVFSSPLTDIEMRVLFPEKYPELYLPSNLRVISPSSVGSFYDSESNMLIWESVPKVEPGETLVFEFQCAWDVVNELEEITLEIRGTYLKHPLIFENYIYTTPTGFPVMGSGESAIWNPGGIEVETGLFLPGAIKDGELYQDSTALKNMVRNLSSKPSFFEKVEINMENIKAQETEILSKLSENRTAIEQIQKFVSNMNGKNMGGEDQ